MAAEEAIGWTAEYRSIGLAFKIGRILTKQPAESRFRDSAAGYASFGGPQDPGGTPTLAGPVEPC